MRSLHILSWGLLLFLAKPTSAANFVDYKQQLFIDTWANLAVEQMRLHQIPASITLAQAIVESGWGDGYVARLGNNYFCIKSNNGWAGPVVKAQDDDPDSSSFRQYMSIEESFNDHAKFLKENNRYRTLFDLNIYDYKGWARGLKSCGYATKSDYAEYLIATIEKYGLYMYDYASPEDMPTNIVRFVEPPLQVLDMPIHQPIASMIAVGGQEAQAPAIEEAQQAMPAPQYHFGHEATPDVKTQSNSKPLGIPLILPKATTNFDRR